MRETSRFPQTSFTERSQSARSFSGAKRIVNRVRSRTGSTRTRAFVKGDSVRFASKNASTPARKQRARFQEDNNPDELLPEPKLVQGDDSDEEEVQPKRQKFSATQNKVYCRENPRTGAPILGYLEQGELIVVEEMNNGWVKHSKGWTQIKKGRRVYLEAFEDASPRLNKLGKTHSLGIRLLSSWTCVKRGIGNRLASKIAEIRASLTQPCKHF